MIPRNFLKNSRSDSGREFSFGFTIVELLVVVVVIAILAAVTIVAYNGVRSNAVTSAVKSELQNAAKNLELSRIKNNIYPESDSGLARDDSINFFYTYDNTSNPPTYCLTATHSSLPDIAYHIDQSGAVEDGACDGHNVNEGNFDTFTWENIGPVAHSSHNFATNYDGRVVYAAYGDNSTSETPHRYINKSTDGGSAWTVLEDTRGYYWDTVETSSNGQKVIASYSRVDGGPISVGGVWVSIDSGQTWSEHETLAGLSSCCEVAVSSTGNVMVASGGNRTYVSKDDGSTWQQVASRRWPSISLSGTGEYSYVSSPCGSSQGLGVSSNNIASWTLRTTDPRCVSDITTSGDGRVVIGGFSSSMLGWDGYWRSEDYGATWETLNLPSGNTHGMNRTKISSSGRVAISSRGSYARVYVSVDGGKTWDYRTTSDGPTSASRYVRSLALSGNGRVFYAANAGFIYKGVFDD